MKKSLLVPFASWAFLKAKSRKERMGKNTSEPLLKEMYSVLAKRDGKVVLNGKSLGGKQDGEVTTWSIPELKSMLDAENLPYDEIEEEEETPGEQKGAETDAHR